MIKTSLFSNTQPSPPSHTKEIDVNNNIGKFLISFSHFVHKNFLLLCIYWVHDHSYFQEVNVVSVFESFKLKLQTKMNAA